MNGFRIAVIGTLLAFAPAMALAQATPTDAKKPAADAPAAKAAKKPDAKADAKAEPKKTAAKKKVENKDATKAQPAARPAPKKPLKTETAAKPAGKSAPKSTSTTAAGGTVETYQAGQAPSLRDKEGNAILTSPDAFNVDSARKK